MSNTNNSANSTTTTKTTNKRQMNLIDLTPYLGKKLRVYWNVVLGCWTINAYINGKLTNVLGHSQERITLSNVEAVQSKQSYVDQSSASKKRKAEHINLIGILTDVEPERDETTKVDLYRFKSTDRATIRKGQSAVLTMHTVKVESKVIDKKTKIESIEVNYVFEPEVNFQTV